jgi:hypothetical protein
MCCDDCCLLLMTEHLRVKGRGFLSSTMEMTGRAALGWPCRVPGFGEAQDWSRQAVMSVQVSRLAQVSTHFQLKQELYTPLLSSLST